jgi:hypothetical protein
MTENKHKELKRNYSELIHDTNSSIGRIKRSAEYLSKFAKENINSPNSSRAYISIEYIKDSIKDIQDSIDLFYKQLNNKS